MCGHFPFAAALDDACGYDDQALLLNDSYAARPLPLLLKGRGPIANALSALRISSGVIGVF